MAKLDIEAIVSQLTQKGECSLNLMGKFPKTQVLWACINQQFFALTDAGIIYDLQWDGHYKGTDCFNPKEIGRLQDERCVSIFGVLASSAQSPKSI